jgi:hypothetical protein
VIASIHQPSTSTFQLFDKLLLLSRGRSHYFGPVKDIGLHFDSLGLPIPIHTNPAEFLLELMNVDFSTDGSLHGRLEQVHESWVQSPKSLELSKQLADNLRNANPLPPFKPSKRNFPMILMILVHRSFIKSYRDVVAYGIRIAMYAGLAIMMGTVWLRLHNNQDDIQPYINAIVSTLIALMLDIGLIRISVLRVGIHVFHGRCVCP